MHFFKLLKNKFGRANISKGKRKIIEAFKQKINDDAPAQPNDPSVRN